MQISSTLNIKSTKRRRTYQYLAALTGTLGIVSSEMHYGWPSPSLPALTDGSYRVQITASEAPWLVIMPLLGAIVGAVITGLAIDSLGRKRLILFSSVPFFASWLMIGLAETSVLLHVARFVGGFTDGLSFTAVPMFLGEIAEPRIRGLLASLCPLSIVLGLLLINLLGSWLSISSAAFAAASVPVVLLATFAWVPESPYFLLMKGRREEARRSLQLFRGTADVDAELERLAEAVRAQNADSGRLLDLFTVASNRKAVFIALGLRTVQQLSGTTAIIIYCKTIFAQAEDFLASDVATVVYFAVQLALSALASVVVDICGRRPLLIVSVACTALTLLVQGTYLYLKNCTQVDTAPFHFVPLVALLCFVVAFSLGLQTIPLLVMAEMFPTNVKAFALCLADVYFSVMASLISVFFHATNAAFGMHVPFYTFTACCGLGLVFIVLCVPETKGRTLEDIQRYLKGEIRL